MTLDIRVATGPLLDDWRAIHNTVVPTAPLSAADVAERAARHRLALAHGFVEHDRYLLDGDTVPFIDLHLPG